MRKTTENNFLRKDRHFMLILFLWAFILYGNTLDNKYAMDYSYVIDKQTEKGVFGLSDIFTTRYFHKGQINYGYRPVVKATFAIEQSLWGQQPFMSHLINVLLYAFLGILIFKFFRKIFKSIIPVFSFLIVLVFMAHPVHTEVVASLKNREELLVFIFGISMLYFIFKFLDKKKYSHLFLSVLFVLLGLWTKPTMIVFIVLIPVFLYFFSSLSLKKVLLISVTFMLTAYILLKIPNLYIGHGSRTVLFYENPLIGLSLFNKIPTAFSVLFFYIKKMLIPYPLLFYYGYNMIPIVSYSSSIFIVSLILLISIITLAIYYLKKDIFISFSIVGFIVSIFGFLNVFKIVSGIVAERYLFIASLFFSILIVRIILKYAKFNFLKINTSNTKGYLLIAILVFPYAIITVNRNAQWENELTLFSHDISKLKKSAMANEMYGVALMNEMSKTQNTNKKRILMDKALQAYRQSLSVYPKNKFCLNALAYSYFTFYHDYIKAAKYYELLFPMDSNNVETILNLGFSLEKSGKKEKAIFYYKQAIVLDSLNPKPYSLLANAYYKLHDLKSGNFYNAKLQQIAPNSEIPIVNLANYYIMLNDTETAIMLYDSAATIQPNNQQLNSLLYQYYWYKRDTSKAMFYYNRLYR